MGEHKQKRQTAPRPRRPWLVPGVVGLLAVGLALVAFALQSRAAGQLTGAIAGSSAAGEITGGAIANPPAPAADFALVDQFGQEQRLSDWQGQPVALTFIYTNCPDVCPIISANMHRAYGLLGAQAQDVHFVAVTVDPERDDVRQIHSFSDRLGLTDEWSFLTGSRPQLERVWASYGILSNKVAATPHAGQDGRTTASPETIEHAAPVFLIDRQGRVRAMLPTDVTADTLAGDLKVLLAEH